MKAAGSEIAEGRKRVGRPKVAEAIRKAREFATMRSPKSLANVARIADDPNEKTVDRLRADELLLAYGVGKPAAVEDWSHAGLNVIVQVVAPPTGPTRGVLCSPVQGDVWTTEEKPKLLESQT